MDEAQHYRYSPLKEKCVRLIEVLPTDEESLQCKIHIRRLNHLIEGGKADFIALSYAWGPEQPLRRIVVDELICDVGTNLWLALTAIKRIHMKGKSVGSCISLA